MHPLAAGALALLVVFAGTWLLSIPRRDVSIVDIVWGLSFVAATAAATLAAPVVRARHVVTAVLVTIWGLRLAAHLYRRNHGAGEDFRYAAMRRRVGSAFWWQSAGRVFLVQAVAAWVVVLPVLLAASDGAAHAAVWPSVVGTAVWIVGFAFETIGDRQLRRFRADPANRGRVLDQGLWRYTRHPNYFGDAVQWWGVFLTCIARPRGAFGLLGPLLMTFLLVRVSGVALLERSLQRRKPDYAAYVARTSAFVPRRPRPAP